MCGYKDDTGYYYYDIDAFNQIVSVLDEDTPTHRFLRHTLYRAQANLLHYPNEDGAVYLGWSRRQRSYQGFDRSSNRGNHPILSNAVYKLCSYFASSDDLSSLSPVPIQAKENDPERKTRLLQESKKSKGKAEKNKKKKVCTSSHSHRQKLVCVFSLRDIFVISS